MGSFLRRGETPGLQQGVVGTSREVSRCRATGGAVGSRFRRGRKVPHSVEYALREIFPCSGIPVSVLSGDVSGGRLSGTAESMFLFWLERSWHTSQRNAPTWRIEALARSNARHDRGRQGGCVRHG